MIVLYQWFDFIHHIQVIVIGKINTAKVTVSIKKGIIAEKKIKK
jgi:hypothetical protein